MPADGFSPAPSANSTTATTLSDNHADIAATGATRNGAGVAATVGHGNRRSSAGRTNVVTLTTVCVEVTGRYSNRQIAQLAVQVLDVALHQL